MSRTRSKAYMAFLLSFTSFTAVLAADEKPAQSPSAVQAPTAVQAGAAPSQVFDPGRTADAKTAEAKAPETKAAETKPAAEPAKAAADAAPAPAVVLSPAQLTAIGQNAPPPPVAQQAAAAPAAPAAPHWSYLPVVAPAIPVVQQKDWVIQPLDAFVLAKLESKGLKPSPDTDRANFIRRATLDAWGLLPTPQEVANFVNDDSPKAYEKLIDRLLASPHYGER